MSSCCTKQRRPDLMIGTVVLVLAVLVFGSFRSRWYHGKTVRQWTKVLWAGAPAEQSRAEEAIRTLGTNAVPVLLSMLTRRDSSFTTRFYDLWEKQTVIPYPYLDRDFDQQRLALRALVALGESARPALPVLRAVVQDWKDQSLDVVQEASRIAQRLDSESAMELIISNGTPRLVKPKDPIPATIRNYGPYIDSPSTLF